MGATCSKKVLRQAIQRIRDMRLEMLQARKDRIKVADRIRGYFWQRYPTNNHCETLRKDKRTLTHRHTLGQFVCASNRCENTKRLTSWEVNFGYVEKGEKKNELVKVRLCPECSDKLNYKTQKRQAKREDRKRKRKESESEQEQEEEENEREDKPRGKRNKQEATSEDAAEEEEKRAQGKE